MKIIWKGKIIDEADKTFDLNDRGYQFGDGIYEVTRVYNGHLFAADPHIERLFASAKKVELSIQYSAEEIKTLMEELILANQVNSGYVYLQFTRGGLDVRDHLFPTSEESPVLFSGHIVHVTRPTDAIHQGVKVITGIDERWAHCDVKSLSMQGNVLAKNKAAKVNAKELIFIRDGIVTEGTSSNVMIVKDGKIYSHPNDQFVLPGITKQMVQACAEALQIPFIEENFDYEALIHADEVFITSSILEIMPVNIIDDITMPVRGDQAITKQLQNYYESMIIQECLSIEGHK